MNKKLAAALIAILLPLTLIIVLYFITLSLQPGDIKVSGNKIDVETYYLNSSKSYGISGNVYTYQGEILSPGDLASLSRLRGIKTSFSDAINIKKAENLVDESYAETLHFYIKVPTGVDYAMLIPARFCEYRIYVNGELLKESERFDSENPSYPVAAYVAFPDGDSDIYDVVINLMNPENFTIDSERAFLFGDAAKIKLTADRNLSVGVTILCLVLMTIIFCLIQFILIRQDKTLLTFVIYSVAFLFSTFFLDDGYITALLPHLHYSVAYIIKGLTEPLFLIALLYHTSSLFPGYLKKNVYFVAVITQIVPLLSSLTLGTVPVLNITSGIVTFAVYIICEIAFLNAFIKKERFIIFYIFAISTMEAGTILQYLTADFKVPARYMYIYAYVSFAIVEVISLSVKYAEQNAAEQFYKEELARQLENMQASENAFLNAQMKPHFLYNTLNTIADLCVTDPEKAKSLIASLSDYLKLILSLDNMEETVTLRRELELADSYTAIEKERFPSIKFYKDFPIRMPAIMMPPLVIQPLIENAIKHGVRKLDKPGIVTLKISDDLDSVTFEVSDNGVGMTDEQIEKLLAVPKENKSIGIYNIDKRLKNQYNQGLKVTSQVGLGTCVSFTVPKF